MAKFARASHPSFPRKRESTAPVALLGGLLWASPDLRLCALRVLSFCSLLTTEGVDHQLEVLWAAGDLHGLFVVHPILFDEFQQGLIEGLHTVVLALRDGLLYLACLGWVHDEVPDAPCRDHYLA